MHSTFTKYLILFFAIIIHFQPLNGQIASVVPLSGSIAQTSVADTKNWSAFTNIATLGRIAHSTIQLQFDNRYIIKELSTKSVGLGFTTKPVNVGLSLSHFGYSLYHEILIGLGFARNFSEQFTMGVQFNYYTVYIAATNTYRGVLFPQIGFTTNISSDFSIGFSTFNPTQININTEYAIKRIPSIFSIGTEYAFSPNVTWRTQLDKEISSHYVFATGFEYQMLQSVSIALGTYTADYLVPCMGIGIKKGDFSIRWNGEWHPLLGLNNIATVAYRFGK